MAKSWVLRERETMRRGVEKLIATLYCLCDTMVRNLPCHPSMRLLFPAFSSLCRSTVPKYHLPIYTSRLRVQTRKHSITTKAPARAREESSFCGGFLAEEAMTSPEIEAFQKACKRHGPGDGILKLNVGGKEFITLRSTVTSNRILAAYVYRAEQNGELDRSGAVFIDRDPGQFGYILTFLRNKMEGVAYNNAYSKEGTRTFFSASPKYLRLPKENPAAMQDLYVEATHYRMTELRKQIYKANLWTQLFAASGRNPFEAASNAMVLARRLALTTVGTGSLIGVLQADLEAWLGIKMPWKLDVSEAEDKKETSSAKVQIQG